MRLYAPITKIDKEQRMVWGYASTEARDDQGEVVKKDAIAAALPSYLKLGNIREMHQLSAVGKAKEASVDDKGLFLGAKIVDPVAWEKVTEGVYNGFSIGGRVTSRDHVDRTIINGLELNEISLVDRPANPEALFDVWKAAAGNPDVWSAPLQIWACGLSEHRHTAKAEALKCLQTQKTASTDPQQNITENIPGGGAIAKTAENAGTVAQEDEQPLDVLGEARKAIAAAEGLLAAPADTYEKVLSELLSWLPGPIQGGKPANYGDLLPLVKRANATFQAPL